VAIKGDRIVGIGTVAGEARRVIDATGLVVAPGFIDMHSHSDWTLLEDGHAQSKIRQGVTTEVIGESTSAGPFKGKVPAREVSVQGKSVEIRRLRDYFGAIERAGVSVNVASYVGEGTIWECVMGTSFERPSPGDFDQMKALVAEAMGDAEPTRRRIANEAHADLFVSIHVNAANPGWKTPGGARGFETYFLAEAKTEDARRVEQMENEVVKFETRTAARGGDPLSFLLNDMAQNEHLRESNELAELIQRRIGSVHPGPSRGVKQAGFRVLVTAFMPAVLVEIGFGTNASEASYMTDPNRMEELSSAVADGVLEYLKRYERRVAAGTGVGSAGGVARQ